MNVDIIVTTYKRYDLLQETLKSVANQSYPHWKCWIAEDGESKETYDAVRPFLQDNRFAYLPGEHAGFPSVPRNRGIRKGNAPYVAPLDDDDLWLPKKLERQVAFMEKHPDCVLLGCNACRWDGIGKQNESPLYFDRRKTGKISYNYFLKQNYIIHSSSFMKRNALEKAGLYNETFHPPIGGEDYELFLRIGALGEIWNLSDPLVIYRETPSYHYKKNPGRNDKYKATADIYSFALMGVENIPSPLSYSENAHLAAACRRERDFYLAGPQFLGRLRHEMQSKIKPLFNFIQK